MTSSPCTDEGHLKMNQQIKSTLSRNFITMTTNHG